MKYALVAFSFFLALGASAQTIHTVTVSNFSFEPATLQIEAGDTVRWVNSEGFHNVSQQTGSETFGNGVPASGWIYEFTFTQIGTSTYLCSAHPGSMQGSVTVSSTTAGEPGASGANSLRLAGANPFRDVARLTLELDRPQTIRATVFDALGREVAVLLDGMASQGETDLTWTPEASRSGVYVVRVSGPEVDLTQGIARIGRTGAAHH